MEKSKENSRILDMTKGNPFHLILTFALPLFFGNLLQQFYNLADTAIAGHILGDAALAQIGATAALYSLITNFAFGMNNGLALAVSRAFGAGNKPGIKRAVGWMVILSMGTAVLLAVLFVTFRLPLLQLLQVPQDTMTGALSYLTVILMGIPLTMAYNMESAMLQAVGNSVTPLLFPAWQQCLKYYTGYLLYGAAGHGHPWSRHSDRSGAGDQCIAGIPSDLPTLSSAAVWPGRYSYVTGFCMADVQCRTQYGFDECDL